MNIFSGDLLIYIYIQHTHTHVYIIYIHTFNLTNKKLEKNGSYLLSRVNTRSPVEMHLNVNNVIAETCLLTLMGKDGRWSDIFRDEEH